MKSIALAILPAFAACLAGCAGAPRQSAMGLALAGFETPQDSARTKVWWFHGETETTSEGITADLEAFREAGIGGVVYYDQVHGDGEGALDAFSPGLCSLSCPYRLII